MILIRGNKPHMSNLGFVANCLGYDFSQEWIKAKTTTSFLPNDKKLS